MNILLIKPETVGIFSYTYLVEHEPLEMEYLYTVFTAMGHHAVIYDRRYELISMKKKLKEVKPDVVCVTGYITQQKLVIKYCDVIKSYDPKIQIILGGSNVEINYANYFDSKADYLYHLSGLENQKKLIRYIEQKRQVYDRYNVNNASDFDAEEKCGVDGHRDTEGNGYKDGDDDCGTGLSLKDIPGICYRENGEWVVNPKVVETPADLPVPDRTYFYKNKHRFRYLCFRPLALVKNSYSCRKACNFCFCTNRNSGRYACRSVESLVDEIASLDVPAIHITDDDFLIDRDYLKEFIRLIKEKDIHKKYLIYGRADFIAHNEDIIKEFAEIGLSLVMVGLEATSEEELDSYNKRVTVSENEECIRILSENNVICAGLFIVHPGMTKEDFKKLYNWIAARDIIPTVSVFTPMQGSAMYKKYESQMINKDVTKQDLFHCLLKPEHMSVGAFTMEYYKLSLGLAFKNRKSPLYKDNNYPGAVLYIIKVFFVKMKRAIVL
ncbi:MAG: radical SAM protein [Lachnospiraceae bacterium]|nr:radical SAM protein [Lachnospiraceae bacterium]